MGGLGCRAVMSRSDWSICRTDKVQTTLLASTQWSRTERIVLFDVGIVVKITNGLVWSVLLPTTISVKTVVKIVDLLNEHNVKKYNSQMFRSNLWIAALYLSYMKALKKRIQQISWTTPNCNIVVIAKKSEIKNRKKTKQELICT